METTTDTSLADTIVTEAVVQEQEEGQGQTVAEFGESVQWRVTTYTEGLREEFGDAVEDVAGEAMKKSVSYAEARQELLDPQAKVGDTEKIGAAAYNDKMDNSVTYSVTTMDYNLQDPDYWKRVAKHEQIHQEDQAANFNRDHITYVDGTDDVQTVEVRSTIVEWQPSSQANKPEDLTTEYQEHVDKGEQLAKSIGPDGKELMEDALKTGDMQGLQVKIIERQREQILEKLLGEEIEQVRVNQ